MGAKTQMGGMPPCLPLGAAPDVHDLDRQRATPSSVEYSRWRAITGSGDNFASIFCKYCRRSKSQTGLYTKPHTYGLSHTRTIVRECFKGDGASQWKRPKFDPSPRQNPFTDLHKNWQAWLRRGRHPACKVL